MENTKVFDRLHKISHMLRRANGGGKGRGRSANKLLQILLKQDGITAGELAEILDIRPSSLTEQFTRLEHHGLVERKRSDTDLRVVQVFITPKGKEETQKLASQKSKERAELVACFTPEEEAQFIALCDKLIAHLQQQMEQHPAHHHHHHRGHGHHIHIAYEEVQS